MTPLPASNTLPRMDRERAARVERPATAPRILRDLRTVLIGGDPPPPPPRFPRLRRALGILSVLAAIGSLFIFSANFAAVDPRLVWVASSVAVVPLALVVRWPLLAWRIGWVTAALLGALVWADRSLPWPWEPIQILIFPILLYAVAVRHPRGVTVWVGVFTIGLVAAYVRPSNSAALGIAVVVILLLGDQVRRRREAQRELVAEEERSELEKARRAVLEERTRIAREMHDVVAHHMSLIAVRAETAEYRLGGLPAATTAEFAGIAATAREALIEMRRLLGVLRSESPDLARAPQPDLEELDALVAAAREAGVDVQLRRVGVPDPLPPSVGLSAYRIVQEALSNASRHAPGAAVHIDVRGSADALDITVVNGPAVTPTTAPSAGARHGLIGMRERVAMLGGELAAGPTPDGGFELRARLPLEGVS
jgi:signal transduction histidine kinase